MQSEQTVLTEREESLAETVEMMCMLKDCTLDEVTGVRGQTIQVWVTRKKTCEA